MAEHATERITVDAPPERVFEIAVNFDRYPDWASDVKSVDVLRRDDDGRGGLVAFRAAAMGRSTRYVLLYYFGTNPLRMAWRLVDGDVIGLMNGEYLFEPVAGRPGRTEVTYHLGVELKVPLPGFVRRRAEARIMRTALDELRQRAESAVSS